jgi:two-component system sensor kinase FixL
MQREQPDLKVLTEICAKIDEQALRAGQVVENIRRFIRKQDAQVGARDVNAVIADALNLVEADAHAEGIPVATRYADGLPLVRADAVQLQQVLLNLTRNSVDAMRDGLAKGRKERGIVIETTRAEHGGVRISVIDYGPGVSPRLADHIFHPFVTTKRDGLGVGLAISRTIVQSYGGSLTYLDNPEGGAIFVVELQPSEGAHD